MTEGAGTEAGHEPGRRKITSRIVETSVVAGPGLPGEGTDPGGEGAGTPEASGEPRPAPPTGMDETVARPIILRGKTYKIGKDGLSERALYITINDIVLNEGTAHEERRPYEMFINSKEMAHFQWVVALTRVVSAVFRKGGDVWFLTEELQSVFDPRGGGWSKGRYVPSIVAAIGDVIATHMADLGMAPEDAVRAKPAAAEGPGLTETDTGTVRGTHPPGPPKGAGSCPRCITGVMQAGGGCTTCMSCGYSKCS